MGKSAPSPPSPTESAQAQAQANRINQITPFGNLIFKGPNRNRAVTTFSPDVQQIINSQLSAQGDAAQRADRLGNAVLNTSVRPQIPGQVGFRAPPDSNLVNALQTFRGQFNNLQDVDSGAGALGSALDQFNSQVGGLGDLPEFSTTAFDRGRIEDALFNRGLRLLRPEQERQQEQLRNTLANQGLPQGQEAFNDEFNRLGQQQDLALADLADRAILLGGQEADRTFGQDLGAFQAQLQGRGQGFAEALGGLGARAGIAGQQFGQDLGLRQQQGAEALQRLGAISGIQDQRLQQALQEFGVGSQQRSQNIERELLRRQVPLNELQALLGLSQTQQPSFFGPGQVDVLGAQALQQQAAQNSANNQSGLFGSLIGLGGLLGGSVLGNFQNIF